MKFLVSTFFLFWFGFNSSLLASVEPKFTVISIKPIPKVTRFSKVVGGKLCSLAFGPKAKADIKGHSFFLSGVASHQSDGYSLTNRIQGRFMEERSTDNLFSLSEFNIKKLTKDWRENHSYTEDYLSWLNQIHYSLKPQRISILRIEELSNFHLKGHDYTKPTSNALSFSMIRIYDSSVTPLVFGRKWNEETDHSLKSVAETALDINLNKILEKAGIEKGNYTWSLGLIDSSGRQEAAAKTLLGQVADQVDLHYNNRNYNVWKNTTVVENNGLDIVAYTNARTRKIYERLLGIKALADKSTGEAIRISKKGEEFYVFHLKGEDLLERHFTINALFPKYRELDNAATDHRVYVNEQILGEIRRVYPEVAKTYRPIVTDLQSFLYQSTMLANEFFQFSQNPHKSERDLYLFMAKLHIFSQKIPHNRIETEVNALSAEQLMSKLDPFLSGIQFNAQHQEGHRPSPAQFKAAGYSMVVQFIDRLFYDPVNIMIGWMNKK